MSLNLTPVLTWVTKLLKCYKYLGRKITFVASLDTEVNPVNEPIPHTHPEEGTEQMQVGINIGEEKLQMTAETKASSFTDVGDDGCSQDEEKRFEDDDADWLSSHLVAMPHLLHCLALFATTFLSRSYPTR